MRILVTGVSGALAPALLKCLINNNHEVVVTSRSSNLNIQGVSTIRIDLAQDILDCSKYQAIIHAAGTAMASGAGPQQIIDDNVTATKNLLNAANHAGVKKFVFFSTMSVYGKVLTQVVDENTPIVNPNIYGTCKYLCEQLIENNNTNMASTVLRLPAVLATNVWGHWLSEILYRAKNDVPITAYNPESKFNNAIDVRDLSKFVLNITESNNEGFKRLVLASDDNISIRRICELLGNHHDLGVSINYATAKEGFKIDPSIAIKQYGFMPRPIEESISSYFSGAINVNN